MRVGVHAAAVLSLVLCACGVSQSQYDRAVKDARDAQASADANEQRATKAESELARLRAELAQAKRGGESSAELEELRKQKAAIEARLRLFEEVLQKLKSMIDAGKLKVVVRRGQIVLVLATDVLFDLGKTEIKPEGKAALTELAATLRTVRGRRFQVAGHTDSVRIRSKEFASNWELSTARALTVVHFLIVRGVGKQNLSAAGYGEYDPIVPNTTPDGRAKNRRIEITLQPNIEELVALPELGE